MSPSAGSDRRTWSARAVAEVAAAEADRRPVAPVAMAAAVASMVAGALGDRPSTALRAGLAGDHVIAEAQPLLGRLHDLAPPPAGWADPWLPGVVHEQAAEAGDRSARGAWYTPEPVVRGLVALATGDGRVPGSVIDPTCGGGAFLLAALDRFVELGLGAEAAIGRVGGTDIDADAARVARWSVALWAAANGVDVAPDEVTITVADALTTPRWGSQAGAGSSGGDPIGDLLAAGGVDGGTLVIGNPPFATPLRSGRLPPTAEAYRAANATLLGPYADLAAVHLLCALRSVGSGSVLALVLPQSVLSGRDTGELRHHCAEAAPLQALWATREAVFDAGVRACGVVLAVGGRPPTTVSLAAGPSVEAVMRPDPDPVGPDRWAEHAARALGAPSLPASLVDRSDPSTSNDDRRHEVGARLGTVGDLASATAGFRDEYYGLVAACREWDRVDEAPNRLATVGAVDPLDHRWGRVPCKFGGRSWQRPTIDRAELDDKIGRWVEQRLVPKVVLATQSRVLEPVVDRAGVIVPATPLVSVEAEPDDLDRIAAVLLAPPVVAWAWQRWFGSALAVDALKLAARQVLALPLPPDRGAWHEAAELVSAAGRAGHESRSDRAEEVAAVMNRAYGAGDEVLTWWRHRRPGRPAPTAMAGPARDAGRRGR